MLAAWSFRVLPDEAPSIEFRAPPQATRTGAITFSYGITDDYGAARGWAEIRLAGDSEGEVSSSGSRYAFPWRCRPRNGSARRKAARSS